MVLLGQKVLGSIIYDGLSVKLHTIESVLELLAAFSMKHENRIRRLLHIVA